MGAHTVVAACFGEAQPIWQWVGTRPLVLLPYFLFSPFGFYVGTLSVTGVSPVLQRGRHEEYSNLHRISTWLDVFFEPLFVMFIICFGDVGFYALPAVNVHRGTREAPPFHPRTSTLALSHGEHLSYELTAFKFKKHKFQNESSSRVQHCVVFPKRFTCPS